MLKHVVIFAALVAIAAAECTPEEFRKYRPPGTPPCERPTEKCAEGTRPYQTITPDTKCCPTCYLENTNTGGSGGDEPSHTGSGTGGDEPPMCTAEKLKECRQKLEAKTIPQCQPGEVSVPKDCCISCVPSMDIVDACREMSKDDLRVKLAALPVCAEDEKQEFDSAKCVPTCRREQVAPEECQRDNGDAVKKCIENAAYCRYGNMQEQQLGIQGCCATCRPGGEVAIAGNARNFRECLKADTYRECAEGELPARIEGSDCPSCFIPKPKCDPECAKATDDTVGERCAWRFGGDNIAEREAVCVAAKSKRFCVTVDNDARRAELKAMSADDLKVELKSLIADYCATRDAHRYCRVEALLNQVLLGLMIEEFDSEKLCFNIVIPPLGQVLTEAVRDKVVRERDEADSEGKDEGDDDDDAFTPSYAEEAKDREEEKDDESPSGADLEGEGDKSDEGGKGGKRAVWEEDTTDDTDYALVNAAVGSDYAKSSGFSGSASEREVSSAASLTVSTLVVCAAFVALLL